MFKINNKTASLFLLLFSLFFLGSCQSEISKPSIKASQILRVSVSAKFAPDGRLWRLIPTADTVFVDYSDDEGKSYSLPIKINPHPQKMSAWSENPPAIEISKSGRIHVLYYADEKQKSTNFYSYSDDKGKTFSLPVLISDRAESSMHYMAKMLLDDEDNLYFFWHDTRHEEHNHHLGSGVLALYYTKNNPSEKNNFKNQLISQGVCSCCRSAAALDAQNQPVIFTRMVFENGARDHALFSMNDKGLWSEAQRITQDEWKIEACPEHGPALAIDSQNRSHLTWFSLGEKRQGIFYAYSDDEGKTLSKIITLGDNSQLAGHPDVLVVNERVVIVWSQFDGKKHSVWFKSSSNRGKTWLADKVLVESMSKISHPKLLKQNNQVFLSLTNKTQGHQMTRISYEN